MRKGVTYSGVGHGLLLLFVAFGLPFCTKRPPPEPEAYTVEILPITEIANLKPSVQPPEKAKEQEKTDTKPVVPESPKEEAPKKTNKKEVQETSKPKEAKPEEVIPEPKKEEPVKKEIKKEPDKDKKKKDEDAEMKKIFESVKELSSKDEAKADKQAKKAQKRVTTSVSENYDSSKPLSMSEKNAIVQQIKDQWNTTGGTLGEDSMIISLLIYLNPDGTVVNVEINPEDREGSSRYMSDAGFRAWVDSAKRSAWLASPLRNLNPEKYGSWTVVESTFRPSDQR